MTADDRAAPPAADGLPAPVRCALFAVLVIAAAAHLLATLQPVFSDEFLVLGNFWEFIQHRTIIPSHTQYPALYSYLTAPVTGLFAAVTVALGRPPSIYDLSEWVALHPEMGMWPARLVSLVCWGVCVWVVWRSAREMLADAGLALVAAAAFAAALGTLEYSGYGLPDVAMMMFAALALLHALRLARGDRPVRSAFFAGLLAGFAVATKYTAVAIAVPLLVAAWASPREGRVRAIARMAGWAVAGFVIGCPGWIIAPGHYWAGLMYERAHMARGHLGFSGVPLLGQLELLVRADAVLVVLALVGVIAFAFVGRRGRGQWAVLVAAAGAVLLMAAPAKKQSLQYLFVIYPVMAVLVACGPAVAHGRARRLLAGGIAPVLVASALAGAFWGVRVGLMPDTLEVARAWINVNLPEGAPVAVDWIDVPRLVAEEELERLRADLRTQYMREAYAGLRGFPSVPMVYDEAFARDTQARYIITSSTCFARFFQFGRCTRIPPPEGTELRAEFDRRRAFYEALFEGRYGWRIAHDLQTGNGPQVVIFERTP